MAYIEFSAYDSSGALLPGLTPTWHSDGNVFVAATGALVSGPAISAVGGGRYRTALPSTQTGIVYFGPTASPRYLFIGPKDGTNVVAAWDASGAPKTGLTIGLALYVDDSGTPITDGTTKTELGRGLYRIDGIEPSAHVEVDFTSAASPKTAGLMQPPGYGPTISQTPPSGTAINPTDYIQVDITDADADLNAMVLKAAWGDESEVVWDPYDTFAAKYPSPPSTRVVITNGWRFTLLRRDGWPSGKTVEVLAVAADEAGNSIP